MGKILTVPRNYFKNHERIYIPECQLRKSRWVSVRDCVWDGPDWLAVKSRLSVVTGSHHLKHLFKTVLKIRDAVWHDSLEELSTMRKNLETNHSKASQIYRSLWRDFEKDSNHDNLQ